MSITAIRWALSQNVEDGIAKFVLVVLANYADDQGEAFPKISTLEADTSQSESTVRRKLQWLRDNGFLSIEAGKNLTGRQGSNRYRLPLVEGCRAETPGRGRGVSKTGLRGVTADTPLTKSRTKAAAAVDRESLPWMIEKVAQATGAKIQNPGRVETWLAEGFDIELDIVAAIEAVMRRRRKNGEVAPRDLAYFDAAIADTRMRRLRPVAVEQGGGPSVKPGNPYRPQVDLEAFAVKLAQAEEGNT